MKRTIFSMLLMLMIVTSAFSQKLISVKDTHGNQLLLQTNQQTGSAHRIYGHLPNINIFPDL